MESAKRVLVYLSKDNSLLQCACGALNGLSVYILQAISALYTCRHQDKVLVNCGLDQNRFIMSDKPFRGSSKVQLQGPVICPFKNLTPDQAASLPEATQTRGVEVAIYVLLQSTDKRFLLTRRSKSLNVFPHVWVPPGGHMEPGEQLLEAGLRELQEETGLCLRDADLPWRIAGLWESAFPPLLTTGLPTHHHIVTYLLVSSTETHQELQEKLRPDEREVSACVWLDPQTAERIVATEEGVKDSGKNASDLQTSIKITEVNNGSLTQRDLDVAILLNAAPDDGEDVGRVISGTKYALRLWLETLRPEEEAL
ncbi:m7GpppN-mRNA hydrolase NUDT17-like [Mixophyes fleayi]|uniref:m7GpppN-mRNA hydrolase NUDT17-like n=1 Tax=Mixophyes fleayi TaxID=3061075 RepID=UPI003F4D9D1B